MIDINELRQSLGAIQPEEVAELLDRLEAAEKERESWKGLAKQFGNEADALRAELSKQQTLTVAAQHIAEVAQSRANQLQARIEAMEKQEPVVEVGKLYMPTWCGFDSVTSIIKRHGLKIGSKLYHAPGAKGEEK